MLILLQGYPNSFIIFNFHCEREASAWHRMRPYDCALGTSIIALMIVVMHHAWWNLKVTPYNGEMTFGKPGKTIFYMMLILDSTLSIRDLRTGPWMMRISSLMQT
jgi:hypothetical protein